MIGRFLFAIWIATAALGAAYGSITFRIFDNYLIADKRRKLELVTVITPSLSVPVVTGEQVRGYIVARFSVTYGKHGDESEISSLESFVIDEAYKLLYARDAVYFLDKKELDLEKMKGAIMENTNRRLGAKIVHQILIQDLMFLNKEDARK